MEICFLNADFHFCFLAKLYFLNLVAHFAHFLIIILYFHL